MRTLFWAIAVAAAVVVLGILFGVAGIFLAPILGGIALVAAIVWILQRAARDKPPVP